jgi:Cu-processing system permease protein
MMTPWTKVMKYQIRNVIRARAVAGYALFFLVASGGLVRMAGGVERALPSLANLSLFLVPLVSIVITVVFLYDGRAFNELLLAHPLRRRDLFLGVYLGLTIPLAAAVGLGVGLPLLLMGGWSVAPTAVLVVPGIGMVLTAVFTGLGCVVAVRVHEPARGLGLALVLWLLLTVAYDGVVLIASQALAAWPLEKPMLAAMILNPVDLGRLVVLMTLDASVLLGYTGAVFQRFFGGAVGIVLACAALAVWVLAPCGLALRRFRVMDL